MEQRYVHVCSYLVDFDECAPTPCQNGGVCTDGYNSYTCECDAIYAGDSCEIRESMSLGFLINIGLSDHYEHYHLPLQNEVHSFLFFLSVASEKSSGFTNI